MNHQIQLQLRQCAIISNSWRRPDEGRTTPEFESDDYIEKLLRLRETDRIQFQTLPNAVREIVEEYERGKEAAKQKEKSD